MALIKCAECGKELSDQATACPSCGSPVKGVTTIEATGKRWKVLQLVCVLAIIVGIIIVMLSALNEQPSAGGVVFGVGLIGGGLIGLIIAKIFAWWHHG